MRRFSLLPVALAAVLLSAGIASAQSIAIDPNFMDLGKMRQMETKTFKVKVTNNGAGLLVISEVRADCGCTVPEMKVKSLKAGESTDMTVTFDAKKFVGPVHKIVHIVSNDPDHPDLEFSLDADVAADLIIYPASERIAFDRSYVGQTPTVEVSFTAPERELKLSASKSEKGLVQVKVVNGVDGDPHKSVLRLTQPATLKPGQFEDVVRVSTNVPERPTVDIGVRGWISTEIAPFPDVVNFRYQPQFDREIRIAASQPPMDFKVLRAEIDLPEIRVEISKVIPHQETHVRLTGAPIDKADPRAIATKGRIDGVLKIYTDVKSVPVIEVPVSYMIRM